MQDGEETQQNESDKELAGEGQAVTSNRVDRECPTEKGTLEPRLQGGDSVSWRKSIPGRGNSRLQALKAAECLEFLKSHEEARGWSREKSDGDALGEDTEGAESGRGLGPGTCTT